MKTKLIIFIITVIAPVVVCTQNRHVQRVFTDTDTCRVLQIIGKANHLSYSGRLHLLDEHQCIKEEKIALRRGLNWLSFPRTEKKYVVVNDVLGNDNIECSAPYPYGGYFTGSFLENIPIGADIYSMVINHFDGGYWTTESGLDFINSRFGYKLFINTLDEPVKGDYFLRLHGKVNTFDTIEKIYANRENWVGYWLFQKQNIFDALGEHADDFTVIKHQDWVCMKGVPINNQWYCNQKSVNMRYGDMVILSGDRNIVDFQWHLPKKKASVDSLTKTEHFIFKPDRQYNPVLVVLDTTGFHGELAVFEGARCVGAVKIYPKDSMVVVPAYYHFGSADTLTFRLWDINGKEKAVRNYYLFNEKTGKWKKDYAFSFRGVRSITVSLKKPTMKMDNELDFKLLSGYFRYSFAVEYSSEKSESLQISLYDMQGNRLFVQKNGKHSGTRVYQLNTEGLREGLYLLRLSTEYKNGSKRILILNRPKPKPKTPSDI